MSIQLRTQVVGLGELLDALKQLPHEITGKAGGPIKLALKAAAQPVLESQMSEAMKHTDTGTLFGALKIMRHPRPKYLNELFGVGVIMGPRPEKGQDQDTGRPWYAEIVERGGVGKTGPLEGFMRKSLETNREKSNAIFKKHLATSIIRIAKKVGNENARKVAVKVRAQTGNSSVGFAPDVQSLVNWRPKS